ncbi:Protein AIR2 [Paramyrothecium foliicola]|nr:Protein AIR2 [Paramyrothecium foliicola]
MASQANTRDDVISIGSSSSDESASSYSPPPAQRKRLRTDEKDDVDRDVSLPRSTRASSRNPKRAKIDSGSSRASGSNASGSEDGEIDESALHRTSAAEAQAQPPLHAVDQQPGLTKTDQGVTTKGNTQEANGSLDESSSQAVMLSDPPLFKHESLSLKLPTLSQRRDGSWPSRFKDWASLFCTSNAEHANILTPVVVRAALTYYVDHLSGLKRPKKKTAKSAINQMEESGVLKHVVDSCLSSTGAGRVAAGPDDGNAASSTKPNSLPGNSIAPGNTEQNKASADASAPVTGGSEKPDAAQASSTETNMPSVASGTHTTGQGISSNGVIEIRRENLPLGTDAVEQQHRYFPSASDPSSMCLLCGQQGHAATNCTDAPCKFCSSLDHWHFSCPSRVRCGKCRQLGHGTSRCVEKLALTKAEGLACSFCGASDHSEQECTDVWRSFHPDATTVHPVVFISPSCARCGSGEHYAADCGQRRNTACNPTWSLRNRNLYIDPNCGTAPIEDAGGPRGPARVTREPEIKIRGHAARTNNVHYSESDDSDVEFLGSKNVQPRAPVGQIRMASNIQMPRGQATQPPLPAEPLPPIPTHGRPSRLPLRGTTIKPPRHLMHRALAASRGRAITGTRRRVTGTAEMEVDVDVAEEEAVLGEEDEEEEVVEGGDEGCYRSVAEEHHSSYMNCCMMGVSLLLRTRRFGYG